MQAAHQHRAFDHRRLRAIEPLEGRVRRVMRNAAQEARSELMFPNLDDHEFEMRQRRGQSRRGDKSGGRQRPVATSREASREDAHVVGQVRHREWRLAQIIERRRWVKRRQNPSLPLGDQP